MKVFDMLELVFEWILLGFLIDDFNPLVPFSWKLQVCLSECDLLVDPRH